MLFAIVLCILSVFLFLFLGDKKKFPVFAHTCFDICHDQSTLSTTKRMKMRGIPLKHLFRWKKLGLEDIEAIEEWPNKLEEKRILRQLI